MFTPPRPLPLFLSLTLYLFFLFYLSLSLSPLTLYCYALSPFSLIPLSLCPTSLSPLFLAMLSRPSLSHSLSHTLISFSLLHLSHSFTSLLRTPLSLPPSLSHPDLVLSLSDECWALDYERVKKTLIFGEICQQHVAWLSAGGNQYMRRHSGYGTGAKSFHQNKAAIKHTPND